MTSHEFGPFFRIVLPLRVGVNAVVTLEDADWRLVLVSSPASQPARRSLRFPNGPLEAPGSGQRDAVITRLPASRPFQLSGVTAAATPCPKLNI